MAIDPRLNCAAEICCPPPEAFQTRVELLCELGCPDDLAPKMVAAMDSKGISFAPKELMDVIRRLADHPNAS
jgi:hypothetical protein